MAVFRSPAEVQTADGQVLGSGMLYLHLPRGRQQAQPASGTVSLRSWNATAPPAAVKLPDGRLLPIEVSRDAQSDCSRSRILRLQTAWPGDASR
jgi:hypothetical protein